MIEQKFDIPLVARLAQREKQIQQHYRPVIGVHKWFARRPGALFRGLILSEFKEDNSLESEYFNGHQLSNLVIGDPFMGGGTPLFEANRLGCDVVGTDINPMAYWIVRQELAPLDGKAFRRSADEVIQKVEEEIGRYYETTCVHCGHENASVKYFLWVKQIECSGCGSEVDLFSRYVVAKNQRHPNHVLVCPSCRALNEVGSLEEDNVCCECASSLVVDGPAGRSRCECPHCGVENSYPCGDNPPRHSLYALEYHCDECADEHDGRYFKAPDRKDLQRFEEAASKLADMSDEHIPNEKIPAGDESARLHRWGYDRYRQLFNDRQLLGLSVLASAIDEVADGEIKRALFTVFSDSLRYQNMVCRYDTWALKIQDIFSVHGFPVGLAQCENSILGTPGKGSGGFRHFVKKYARAKSYCQAPYEKTLGKPRKKIRTQGETIEAQMVDSVPVGKGGEPKRSYLNALPAEDVDLSPNSLDAVFTDPPYFANVQYAELMDFCYVWLRRHLQNDIPQFNDRSTRHDGELTVNSTEGRDIHHFTEGLSRAYANFARALKEGAPFVFTYHHNEVEAYLPIAVAILDAGLVCTEALPSPAEMGASLHISGTGSSVLDTVFVCRGKGYIAKADFLPPEQAMRRMLRRDLEELSNADLELGKGDAYCLLLGHLTRLAVWQLHASWDAGWDVKQKLKLVREAVSRICPEKQLAVTAGEVLSAVIDGLEGDELPLFAQEEHVSNAAETIEKTHFIAGVSLNELSV